MNTNVELRVVKVRATIDNAKMQVEFAVHDLHEANSITYLMRMQRPPSAGSVTQFSD